MSIIPWDPWKEMQRLRAETDELWDAFLTKFTEVNAGADAVSFLPEVDLVETAYDFRVYMAVPGLVEDDIHIEATNNTLTVRGERQPPYDLDREHVREWRYGYFQRDLTLRKPIEVDGIAATYAAGVLAIVMPKQTATVQG